MSFRFGGADGVGESGHLLGGGLNGKTEAITRSLPEMVSARRQSDFPPLVRYSLICRFSRTTSFSFLQPIEEFRLRIVGAVFPWFKARSFFN
jgi:hypothetical protein